MSGRGGDRLGKNLQLPTTVRTIQTKDKKKNNIEYGPLIKEATKLPETIGTQKRKKYIKTFSGHLDSKQHIKQYDPRSEPDKFTIEELFKLYSRHYSSKRNKYNPRGDFLWTKQGDTETPEDHL